MPHRRTAVATVVAVALATTGMAYSHPGAGTASDDLDGDDLQALVASSAAPILAMQPTTSVDTPAEHAGDAVTVDLAQGTVSFSFPAASIPSIALDDGSDAHVDQAFASIVREQDGAVQVATVIEGTLSPTEYAYDFDADAASLERLEDGSVVVRGTDGRALGAIEAPWAFDARGRAVETSFRIEGLRLVQTVQHDAPDIAYPVLADPTYSGRVLSSAFMGDHGVFGPGRKLTITVSAHGRVTLIETPHTFGTQGWNLLVGSFGHHMPVGTVRNSMRQQWDCHVVGGVAELGTFDLETWRPSKPRWVGRIGTTWPPSAVCNW